MKPKPKPKYLESEQGGQRERWLISYTDFVTILLILFVAIAAQGLHTAQTPPASRPKPTRGKSEAKLPSDPQPQPETKPELNKIEDPRRVLAEADQKLKQEGLDS